MQLSYCVVNTNGREDLLACLRAIDATAPAGITSEVLVLDNASSDGSTDAVRELWPDARLIALERREGKAANDTRLLREARGRYCLLLNEDSELQPGAAEALLEALESDSEAGAAGAQLLSADGGEVPCAWRLPGVGTALAGAVFLHCWLTVQSKGGLTRPVGFAQSSALLVRGNAAAEVGYLDSDFFVYSDETDFAKRLADAGWRSLYVPAAHVVHHDQMASDDAGSDRRIVEFHRNRDLYLRKHKGRAVAVALRPLHAFPYLARAAAALVMPSRSAKRMWRHAKQALLPGNGEGIREAAETYNRRLGSRVTTPADS